MDSITINLEKLSVAEKEQLLRLVEKANKDVKLSEIENGDIFKIGDVEFIKFSDDNGVTTAVTKDIVFTSDFGENNNFKCSKIIERLDKEFLPKIVAHVGSENIHTIFTDLTTFDGLKTYGVVASLASLPTMGFYRKNVEIFDKYKLDEWWWLATAWSALPHYDSSSILCVTPSGLLNRNNYGNNSGVRPVLSFASSIFVSC